MPDCPGTAAESRGCLLGRAENASSPERRLDRVDHLMRSCRQFVPGEVDNFEARRAQVGVPAELPAGAIGVRVLECPVGLGDRPVLAPQEIGAANGPRLSAPTQIWSSGGGRPPSRKATLAIDSNGDSDRASLNSTTCRARPMPGHRVHLATTARNSRSVVFLSCSALSATTTPERNGEVRARSTTVLATEVTGTPFLMTTWSAGKRHR